MRDRAHSPIKLARGRSNVIRLRAFEPEPVEEKIPVWVMIATSIGLWAILVGIAWGLLELFK